MKQFFLSIFYILLRLIVILCAFSAVFCGVIYIVIFTQVGLHWSIAIAKKMTAGHLEIANSSGTFASRVSLKNFIFTNNEMKIKIKQLDFSGQPSQLFYHRLFIGQVIARGVDIYLFDNKTQTSAAIYPLGIKKIWLGNANIIDINIYKNASLITHVNSILITYANPGLNQFQIQLAKGIVTGHFIFNDLIQRKWKIVAEGKDLETNYLWKNSDSRLSFQLESEGEWNQLNKYASLQLSNLFGNVRHIPLSGEIKLNVKQNTLFIDNFDIDLGISYLLIKGVIGQQWNLRWDVQLPDLHVFDPRVSGSFFSFGTLYTKDNSPVAKGIIHARLIKFKQFSVQAADGTLSSILDKKVAQLVLNSNQLKWANYTIPPLRLLTDVKATSEKINTHTSTSLSNANQIQMNLQLPNWFQNGNKSNAWQGDITLKFQDISKFVSSPYITSLKGLLTGHIKLTGNGSQPNLQGTIDITNGQFSIPKLGIQPRAITLHSTFTNSLLVAITGQFSSGAGQGTIKGTVDLNQKNYPFQLALTGNQLQVANTKEYKITASPHFNIIRKDSNAFITGSLLLPYVHIMNEQYKQIVTLPSELTFAGKTKPESYFKDFAAHIQVQLGNDVYIEYQQLHAELAGNLSVFKLPGALATGNGTLMITHGTYQIQDKLFTIENGRFIYVGNLLTDPGLDLVAIQPIAPQTKNFLGFNFTPSDNSSIKVGISVTGTLQYPILTLFSDPPLPQRDILSYMVFGQPSASISGVNALSLIGTLTDNLNMSQPISGNQSNAANGFLSIFKMGSFNPVQAFNFTLPISKHWRLQTETSGTETSADILYEYETKK